MPCRRASSGLARCTGCPSDEDLAAVRPDGARQRLDQGALAGAVVADERDDLARVDGEVGAVQRLDLAVVLGQAAGLQQWLGHGPTFAGISLVSLTSRLRNCDADDYLRSRCDSWRYSALRAGQPRGRQGTTPNCYRSHDLRRLRMAGRRTMRDVAQAAGVSVMTVSRVINGSPASCRRRPRGSSTPSASSATSATTPPASSGAAGSPPRSSGCSSTTWPTRSTRRWSARSRTSPGGGTTSC